MKIKLIENNLPEQESNNYPNKPKLRLDVNPNPTKKGIKVQFVLPKGYDDNQKEELTQKLKNKLNRGLSKYNLSVDTDNDVPYNNVIGFLIGLGSFKLMIRQILDNPDGD